MICTGQRSAASVTQASRSSGAVPSAGFPADRNFSITWLNESSGFSSKNAGHVSQQVLQLVQFERSILTFIMIHLIQGGGQWCPPPTFSMLLSPGHFGGFPRVCFRSHFFFYIQPVPGHPQACPGIRSSRPSSDHASHQREFRRAAG